jgi:hypothetical protein
MNRTSDKGKANQVMWQVDVIFIKRLLICERWYLEMGCAKVKSRQSCGVRLLRNVVGVGIRRSK